jgi:hypothetical protein
MGTRSLKGRCSPHCISPVLAHCRDGGRPSWRPVVEVVLPPLWHKGHTPTGGDPQKRPRICGSPRGSTGGRTDGLLTRSGGFGIAVGRAGLFGASEMRRAPWWGRRPRRVAAAWPQERPGLLATSAAVVAPARCRRTGGHPRHTCPGAGPAGGPLWLGSFVDQARKFFDEEKPRRQTR